MTVLIILGSLAILAALVFSSIAVDNYAKNRYDYSPFSIGNLFFMLIPIALFWGATFFLDSQETLIGALKQGNLDATLMVALSVASLVGFSYHLSSKTNFCIAIFATTVQFAAAVVIIAVILLIAMMRSKGKNKVKR